MGEGVGVRVGVGCHHLAHPHCSRRRLLPGELLLLQGRGEKI